MKYFKLYTLDYIFIKEITFIPQKFTFTGIVEDGGYSKEWFLNGKWHRLDGPAVEWASGKKEWRVNGKPHRLDGPALEWPNGYKEWWIDGQIIFCNTNEEFKLLVDVMKLKGLHV